MKTEYITPCNIRRYDKYYSENKFWKKLKGISLKAGATIIRPVLQLYYMMKSEQVPLKYKTYIIGALGYFILPFDLIPESILPVIGFTDDLAVITLVLKILKDYITPEICAQAENKITELFSK